MCNARLDESKAGIKIAGGNTDSHRYGDDTTLTGASKEELKSLLMKMKKESEKVDLTLNIQKIKIRAPGPITSGQTEGERLEATTDFFLGFKITVDGDCCHEIKKTLAPWKESYDKPRQHIKKQRYHLLRISLNKMRIMSLTD